MPHYVVLVNFTDEGRRNIRDFPKQMEMVSQRAAAAGIKIQRFFTQGQYDVVVLVEAPSDEAMSFTALAAGSQGFVRSNTLRAFTEDEFLQMLRRLPES